MEPACALFRATRESRAGLQNWQLWVCAAHLCSHFDEAHEKAVLRTQGDQDALMMDDRDMTSILQGEDLE
jgi:hypothetical protein